MQTLGQPLQFAFGLDIQERSWLQRELNDHLSRLNQTPVVVPIEPAPADAESSAATDGKPDRIEILSLASDPVVPPSDCSWRREDDFNAIVFRQRGRLERQAVAGLLFINCFWNGVVGVFVLGLLGVGDPVPPGPMWWGMLVFMIPFEVIGLAMFALLLLAVLEPIRTTTWRFDAGLAQNRVAWGGIGRSWTYEIEAIERIELRRVESVGAGSNLLDLRKSYHTLHRAGATFEVGLVGKESTDVCLIRGLTEGEARWMADVLFRERWIPLR